MNQTTGLTVVNKQTGKKRITLLLLLLYYYYYYYYYYLTDGMPALVNERQIKSFI